MNNNLYLIPANTKKSLLIFNFFRPVDLIIFATASVLTLICLFAFPGDSLKEIILKLLPLLIGGFLVLPIPNYHNVLVFIGEMYQYFMNRRVYLWKGWCITSGKED